MGGSFIAFGLTISERSIVDVAALVSLSITVATSLWPKIVKLIRMVWSDVRCALREVFRLYDEVREHFGKSSPTIRTG